MDMQAMGRFLRDLRKENNLSQEELGEKLGVTNKTVSRWETGVYIPPSEMLLELSKLYSVSINEILSGQRLDAATYQGKAEENIVTTLTNTSVAKRQNKRTGIICSAIILVLLVIVGTFLGIYLSSPQYIIITFDSSGGSATEQFVINIKERPRAGNGYLVAEPNCPIKKDSSLEGWYLEPYYDTRWNFDVDTTNSSITLYAKWEAATDGLRYVENDRNIVDGNVIIEQIPGYAVDHFDSDIQNVIIPSYWQGKPVWAINSSAFIDSNIESVIIPDTVLHIDPRAFENCVNLKNVSFGKDVEYIYDSAFYNCVNLQNIDFPLKLTRIGNHAFEGCASLLKVETKSYLLDIGSMAFANCTNLTHFTIGSEVLFIAKDAFQNSNSIVEVRNLSYNIDVAEREDFANALRFYEYIGYSKLTFTDDKYVVYDIRGERPVLVRYFGDDENIELPETFNGKPYDIRDYAFAESDIVSISIPDCVQSIGKKVFYNCEYLETVKLGSQVKSIGESAFEMCCKLRQIDIPDTISYLGESAFSGCSDLISANLGSVTAIESYTFAWCYNLRSIKIPDGVTYIAPYAFYYAGLTDIYISKTVTDINGFAFSCNDLQDIVVEKDNPKYHSANGNLIATSTKTLLIGSINGKIPDDGSVTCIARDAYTHRDVYSVYIPSSIEYIEYGAFRENGTILSITVDENNLNYLAINNCLVSKKGELLFMSREAMIPTDGSVTSIGAHAISFMSDSTIVIPNSVTFIDKWAFTIDGINDLTLRYMGTKEQFLKIVIGEDADWIYGVKKVVCYDGEITNSINN